MIIHYFSPFFDKYINYYYFNGQKMIILTILLKINLIVNLINKNGNYDNTLKQKVIQIRKISHINNKAS